VNSRRFQPADQTPNINPCNPEGVDRFAKPAICAVPLGAATISGGFGSVGSAALHLRLLTVLPFGQHRQRGLPTPGNTQSLSLFAESTVSTSPYSCAKTKRKPITAARLFWLPFTPSTSPEDKEAVLWAAEE